MSASNVTYNGETIEAVKVGPVALEMNYDPHMKVSVIRTGAEDLYMLERRILGRTDGMNEEFDSAAKEFTEVIKWDISMVNAEDLAVWMEVSASIRFCAAITEEWADCVSDYKQERRRIINRWNGEAPAYEDDLQKMDGFFVWQKSPAEKAIEALNELRAELVIEEATAYEELLSQSEDISKNLKDGPTPEAVQRLIDKGQINWSYFNLGGDVEAIPIDAEPDDMAAEVVELVNDPEGFDGDVGETIALLTNIGYLAADRQQNGGTMTSEELDFLTSFYEALEEAGGEGSDFPGVLGVSDLLSENENIDIKTSQDLLGALGEGLLALSDESILGGYDNIPESVRKVVEGPNEENGYDRRDWYPEVTPLANMFGHANPSLHGGEQFSVNLTQTVANELDIWNIDPDDEDDYRGHPLFFNNEHETLIDVSARNKDANHSIITGEGTYKHPTHGLDAEMTFRAVYTHDWDDDGSAASGLTDWIWKQADGDEFESKKAAEAMASFVDLFAEPTFNNSISSTGHSVDGEVVDENGDTVNMAWEDASAGHLNPDIAWEWSELFSAYIDEFGSEHSIPVASQSGKDNPSYWSPEEGLQMDMNSRQSFVQQIMGDGDAASRVYADTLLHGHETLEKFSHNASEDGLISTDGAARSGVLRGLVDVALEQEATHRERNSENAANYQNKVTGYGVDMFGATLSEIPIPGSSVAAEAIKIYSKEEFNVEAFAAEQQVNNNTGEWEIIESTQLSLIRASAESNPDVMESLKEVNPGMVRTDTNGNDYIPPSINQWDVKSSDIANTLRDSWQIVEENGTLPDGASPESAKENYTEAYNNARRKINE